MKSVLRAAGFRPSTVDESNMTVEVVLSTGAEVERMTHFGEMFTERLVISESTVRLGRLNSGAPLLKDHDSDSIDNQIGVVESARVQGGELVGVIRFSKGEHAKRYFDDVKDGILRKVSIGYFIHGRNEVEVPEGSQRIIEVVDFEPFELSFVTVPADDNAQVRNLCDNEKQTPQSRGEAMSEIEVKDEEILETKSEETEEIVSEEPELEVSLSPETTVEVTEPVAEVDMSAPERERSSAILKTVRTAKLDSSFALEHIEAGTSLEAVRGLVINKLAERDQMTATTSNNVEVGKDLSREARREGIVEGLSHRLTGSTLTEKGARYAHKPLWDIAAECAVKDSTELDSMSRPQKAARGLHSTSDFPELLASVLNKSLRSAYEENSRTFGPIVSERMVQDFKDISSLQAGDYPSLEKVNEAGEYKEGSVSESKESYRVERYGRMISLTRELIVNDDLSFLDRVISLAGSAAANLESEVVWAIFTANANMSDGFALFSSQHANLASSGAAPSITTLGAGRAAMRKQTSLDGRVLNIIPRYLVVPAALETVAQQQVGIISPALAGSVNPFSGALQIIAEPRLDVDSAFKWYLAAGQAGIEVARLMGESGPRVDSMIDFNTDGVKYKVVHEFGAKALDHRFLYQDPGQ